MTLPVLSHKDFERFRELIYRQAGISLTENKVDLVRGRLAKRLIQHGLQSFEEYYELLKADQTGGELSAFIDAISTNKTEFFRENSHFEFLEKTWLPELLARKRSKADRKLRIWCAASSSGEEPYTLAIVLNRLGLLDNAAWDTRILATDISTKVLNHASRGEYSPDRVSPIPSHELRVLFSRLPNGCYRVGPILRSTVKFGHMNLLEEPYPFRGPFDFIFCRNVMIYFDLSTRERLVNRLYGYLASGGHFFIGKSESLTGLDHRFAYVMPAIYKKDQG